MPSCAWARLCSSRSSSSSCSRLAASFASRSHCEAARRAWPLRASEGHTTSAVFRHSTAVSPLVFGGEWKVVQSVLTMSPERGCLFLSPGPRFFLVVEHFYLGLVCHGGECRFILTELPPSTDSFPSRNRARTVEVFCGSTCVRFKRTSTSRDGCPMHGASGEIDWGVGWLVGSWCWSNFRNGAKPTLLGPRVTGNAPNETVRAREVGPGSNACPGGLPASTALERTSVNPVDHAGAKRTRQMDGSRAGLGALTHGRARRAGFDGVVCRVWTRDPVESSLLCIAWRPVLD